jgi:hypothetical protein
MDLDGNIQFFGSNDQSPSQDIFVSNCTKLLSRVKMVSSLILLALIRTVEQELHVYENSRKKRISRRAQQFINTLPLRRGISQKRNLSGEEPELVCLNGEYLYLVGTRICVSEKGRQTLLQVGGLRRKYDSLFECVPGSFQEQGSVGDAATCLWDQHLCHEGYILCKEGSRRVNSGLTYPSTSNRNDNQVLMVPECSFSVHAAKGRGSALVLSAIGGMCRHAGKFF